MSYHPANIAGAEKGLTRLTIKNIGHAGRQRHGVAARIALHAFGLAGGTTGVERVAGVSRFDPDAIDLGIQVLRTQGGPVMVAPGLHGHIGQTPVNHQHTRGLVLGLLEGLVQQRLVSHHSTATRAGIGTDDDLGLCIINARSQRTRGKAAKHHGMNSPQAYAGQHGKAGLGNHGHVNLHTVALLHAQRLQHCGHVVDLGMQFAVAVNLFGICLGRNRNQRVLIGTCGQMAVDGVVAKVCRATHKPFGKRRIAVVADLLRLLLPVDQLCLLGPE